MINDEYESLPDDEKEIILKIIKLLAEKHKKKEPEKKENE